MESKSIKWLGNSRKTIRSFPDEAQNRIGNQLWLLQIGRNPDDWKPMQSVGQGVTELRIHYPEEYRVIYVAKFSEAIYVLHVFSKKTEKTLLRDIKIARVAYAEVLKQRKK